VLDLQGIEKRAYKAHKKGGRVIGIGLGTIAETRQVRRIDAMRLRQVREHPLPIEGTLAKSV
jgi:hypothetical protein